MFRSEFLPVLFLGVLWIGDFVLAQTISIPVAITRTWNGTHFHHRPVRIILAKASGGLNIRVNAPFFNDPKNPGGPPGQPFDGLWEYEVVEAFFLNDRNQYIEIELCPHGQHLVLLLNGYRDRFTSQLPIQFSSSINNDTWTGTAFVPASYFPPKVTKFNAYAIHGSGTGRTYEALYPSPPGTYTDPDFHRLEYFRAIDFQSLVPENWATTYQSNEWERTLIG